MAAHPTPDLAQPVNHFDHILLFANQAHLDQKHLFGYAERLELDGPRLRAEMDREA